MQELLLVSFFANIIATSEEKSKKLEREEKATEKIFDDPVSSGKMKATEKIFADERC